MGRTLVVLDADGWKYQFNAKHTQCTTSYLVRYNTLDNARLGANFRAYYLQNEGGTYNENGIFGKIHTSDRSSIPT